MKEQMQIEQQYEPCLNNAVIDLPLGLLGFEDTKRYRIISRAEEAPFQWLQMLDEPHKAFIVIMPHYIIENYAPELSAEDVRFLELKDPQDAVIFNIVTVRSPQEATVNLKGPIVINRHTLKGKQVVPLNATDYSVRHPITTI